MRGAVLPISMVPGDSPIHKIAPLPKLVWSFGVLIISFMTRNPAILGAIILSGIILVTIAQIWKPMLKVMAILFPIMVTTVFLQSIAPAFPRPWTPITNLGPFTIYQEGIYSGITLFMRSFGMTLFSMVTIMTTHPSDLFSSLEKIGMPYTLNFILTVTLQLIPILQHEFTTVLSAQKSRGMKGTGFGAVLPSMVPVFVGAIERVQQLSISLESRAFGSTGKKTSYRNVVMRGKDYFILVTGFLATFTLGFWIVVDKSLDWSRSMTFSAGLALTLVITTALIFASFVTIGVTRILRA